MRYKDTFFVDTCNEREQSFVLAYNACMILGENYCAILNNKNGNIYVVNIVLNA
jgi:hypothetical protein